MDDNSIVENQKEGLEAAPQYRIVDCENGGHKFEISYDVQNFKPNDVKITLENNNRTLVVNAKKEEKKGNQTVAKEYKRQLELPESIDYKNFDCKWREDNMLIVSAPLNFKAKTSADHTRNKEMISQKNEMNLPSGKGNDRLDKGMERLQTTMNK
ncbi:MAG: small heat shock protein (HSP20) [Paramarteilia canceri]